MRSSLVFRALILGAILCVTAGAVVTADDHRPKSPTGAAATQIGDAWIDVTYSRPILRGREEIFGSGETYGDTVTGRAPVWRAGANYTTRLITEAPLVVGGARIDPGEYTLFVELAVRESVPLATFDQKLLTLFPDIAVRPSELS